MLLLSKRDLKKPMTQPYSSQGNPWEETFHYLQTHGAPVYSSKHGTHHPSHGSWRGCYPNLSSSRRYIPQGSQPGFSSTTQHMLPVFLLYVLLKLPKGTHLLSNKKSLPLYRQRLLANPKRRG